MKVKELNSILTKKLFLPKDQNGREIFIYELTDVIFTGENLFYPNVLAYSFDNLYLPIKEKTMSLNTVFR